jgi:hypothetical protein
MLSIHSTTTQLVIPATLPSPVHIGIAAGLARAAQLQRAPVAVPVTVLARWGSTDERTCARVLADLERGSQVASCGPQLALAPSVIDTYLGLYLPMPDVLIQAFAPALLSWSDVGAYALLAAGYRQPAAALARLQEIGLVTRAQVAVAPAELLTLLDQAERGWLTTLDDAGRRVRVQLTQQGRGQQQLCRTGRAREAAC